MKTYIEHVGGHGNKIIFRFPHDEQSYIEVETSSDMDSSIPRLVTHPFSSTLRDSCVEGEVVDEVFLNWKKAAFHLWQASVLVGEARESALDTLHRNGKMNKE